MFYKVISEDGDGRRFEEIDVSPHNLVLMYNDSKKESGYSSNELSDESANESSDESATLELYDTSSNDSCSESVYESDYNMLQSDDSTTSNGVMPELEDFLITTQWIFLMTTTKPFM